MAKDTSGRKVVVSNRKARHDYLILETVEAEQADLVVSGARGLSDLKALMVGSVSHKLSHLSPVTCVTVR